MTTPHKALLIKARDVLLAACGDRCNAEYNPCEYREVASELQAVIDAPEPEPNLTPYGYAPGGYMCTCKTCGKRHDGADKHAWSCKECATAASLLRPPTAPTAPTRTSDEWLANCPQSVRDLANKIKAESAPRQPQDDAKAKAIAQAEMHFHSTCRTGPEGIGDYRDAALWRALDMAFNSGFRQGSSVAEPRASGSVVGSTPTSDANMRQPLTELEIETCMAEARKTVGKSRNLELHFARAIEAAISK